MKTAAKIMIVDDDAEIREIVRPESEGFTSREAADGETALRTFSDEIDLMITCMFQ